MKRRTTSPSSRNSFDRHLPSLALIALTLCASGALAIDNIQVVGLFRDKAVVLIDGNRRILSIGEQSTEGVRLIEADSRQAILEIEGERKAYTLGSRVSTRFATRENRQVTIYRSAKGMFTTVGSINGLPVDFLVDTGATAIAMNAAQARRLGVSYRLDGQPASVRTASGIAPAWTVTLDEVKVGDILQRNVQAYVLEGPEPRTTLLGMSYLGRLDIRNEGQVMVLEEKY